MGKARLRGNTQERVWLGIRKLFLGSGFTLILYLFSLGLSRNQLLSSAYVSIEVISGVASSVGMILAIPLTAFISAALLARKNAAR